MLLNNCNYDFNYVSCKSEITDNYMYSNETYYDDKYNKHKKCYPTGLNHNLNTVNTTFANI